MSESGFALLQHVSHADDWYQSSGESGLELAVNRVIGPAEILEAFGVADDDMGATHGFQHRCGNFSGERAFFFPEHILRAHADGAAADGFRHGGEADKGRAEDDLIACVLPDHGKKRRDKGAGLLRRLVHLPVGGDQFFSHAYLSASASTPGRFLPSRNSTEAPPPGERWLTSPA